MIKVTLLTMTCAALSTVVMMAASLLSKKSTMDREKPSPFECGFDPKASARMPFSLQFFLIAVIFLVFDVEITLLLPMTVILPQTSPNSWATVSIVFIAILMLGLLHEWNQGSLSWAS
uniref:NADH-ubiquinone oxidoreductase chain 3 n=1 Tax=Occasjapyx japonicus TaxID=289462 RepID=U3KTJ7_9HEXA|nr:NADH dehydrogenase subunit 3 [Occasjapyx japonicus]AEV44866.1 NADH dehydrogenase subunit 3 [Occasjapyx japonicus]